MVYLDVTLVTQHTAPPLLAQAVPRPAAHAVLLAAARVSVAAIALGAHPTHAAPAFSGPAAVATLVVAALRADCWGRNKTKKIFSPC